MRIIVMSSNNKVIVFDSSRITRRRVIERFKAPVGKYGKCDIIPHEAEIAEIINIIYDREGFSVFRYYAVYGAFSGVS